MICWLDVFVCTRWFLSDCFLINFIKFLFFFFWKFSGEIFYRFFFCTYEKYPLSPRKCARSKSKSRWMDTRQLIKRVGDFLLFRVRAQTFFFINNFQFFSYRLLYFFFSLSLWITFRFTCFDSVRSRVNTYHLIRPLFHESIYRAKKYLYIGILNQTLLKRWIFFFFFFFLEIYIFRL